MPTLTPADPQFENRVRTSFARQQLMVTLGAQLTTVAPGQVQIELPHAPHLSQQHRYTHAGAVTSVVDSACGYAALTLMPTGTEVVTIEFKVNFLSPAVGERFIATGQVIRAGKAITVCTGEVVAVQGDQRKSVAVMQATMMSVV